MISSRTNHVVIAGGIRSLLQQKRTIVWWFFFVWMQQRPIFPDRLQSSIVGADELNFCVRYENRWDLIANVTAMVYTQLSWIYLFCRCIYHTPFFESRQFLYTIDSQLHRSFSLKLFFFWLPAKLYSLCVRISIFALLYLNLLRSSPRPISIG